MEVVNVPFSEVEIVQEVPEAGWYSTAKGEAFSLTIKPERQWRFGSCNARIEQTHGDWSVASIYAFHDYHVSIVEALDNLAKGQTRQALSKNLCLCQKPDGEFKLEFMGYSTPVEVNCKFNIQPCTLIDEINEDLQNVRVV